MDERIEVLLEMYRVQVQRSQHYENLRSSVTNYLFVVSAILVSIAALDQKLCGADAWIGATMTVLGVFGYAASVAHGRRSARHGKRAAAYRDELDRLLPEAEINNVRRRVPRTSTGLDTLWSMFPIFAGIVGAVITLTSAMLPDC